MSVLDKLARLHDLNKGPLTVDADDEVAFCVAADKAVAPDVASFSVGPSVSSTRASTLPPQPLGFFRNVPVFRAADVAAERKAKAEAEEKAKEKAKAKDKDKEPPK